MDSIRTGKPRGRFGAHALALGIALALTALAPAPASALRLLVSDGGLTAPTSNFACESIADDCNVERDFLLAEPGDAQGFIDIVGDEVSFEITVLAVSFEDPGAGAGDPDVVSFSGVTYSGSAFALTSGDMSTTFSVVVPLVGDANVVGSFATGDSGRGMDPSTPFAVEAELLNFNCLLVGGSGQCGLQVGEAGFTLPVGDRDHDFVHTFNMTVIPEPGTGTLVLFTALGALLVRRLRR